MRLLYAGGGDIAHRTMEQLKHTAQTQWCLRRSAGDQSFLPANAQYMQADLTQPNSLEALPDAMSHVLYTATPDGRTPEAYQAVFNQGLKNLLNALDLSTLKRFVFVSSTAVYGPSATWQDETSPTPAPAFNGQALLKAEEFLRQRLGDKLVVLRFTGIYGLERMALIQRLKAGNVQVAATKGNWANRIHIEDVVQACTHVLQRPDANGVYVGTDDTPIEIYTLYQQLAAWLDAPEPIANLDAPAQGKRFRNQRLKDSGWTPKWPDTLEGYRAIYQQLGLLRQ